MTVKNSVLSYIIIVVTGISLLFTSCKKEDVMVATSIELVSGVDLTGEIETTLANSIVVLVKGQDGNAFQDASVSFAVQEGSVSSAKVTTDANGNASIMWTLGATEGDQILTITALNADGVSQLSGSPITVNATATKTITEVIDIDGNVYDLVTIGNQTWMAEDLRTTKYADGTPINKVEANSEWADLGSNNTDIAYCYYDNNENSEYGALYTWAAATGGVLYTIEEVQGVCPDGLHLPNYDEWNELAEYLGYDVAGAKIKEVGTSHWEGPNEGTTNSTGFTALPGGFRNANGEFEELSRLAFWWTSEEETPPDYAYTWYVNNSAASIMDKSEVKSMGLSVRCILDK